MPSTHRLPDAIEAPTPFSALIHAATIVTAGVYLIARVPPLFEQINSHRRRRNPGCLTLLIAATVGLVQTDIKRVIAYSTMADRLRGHRRLGGRLLRALFRLMTPSFFKALLFMGPGRSSAQCQQPVADQDRRLAKALPFTFAAYIIGGLALSGVPPFSGWLSKDDIIAFTDHRGEAFVLLGIAATSTRC